MRAVQVFNQEKVKPAIEFSKCRHWCCTHRQFFRDTEGDGRRQSSSGIIRNQLRAYLRVPRRRKVPQVKIDSSFSCRAFEQRTNQDEDEDINHMPKRKEHVMHAFIPGLFETRDGTGVKLQQMSPSTSEISWTSSTYRQRKCGGYSYAAAEISYKKRQRPADTNSVVRQGNPQIYPSKSYAPRHREHTAQRFLR